MKIDPYKNKEKYLNWKNAGAELNDVSKKNAKHIREFIFDMENGNNVCIRNKKGSRSYIRLNSYRYKLRLISNLVEKKFKKDDITKLKKEEFNKLFKEMREGEIKKSDGNSYTDPADYIKSFKAFWHWLQNTKKVTDDITIEADTSKNKPKWVYLDEKQFKKILDSCKTPYKTLGYFDIDTGQRPSELTNTRVDDFEEDYTLLNIRDEVSKTFGRKIKVMFSRELIKQYIEDNKLKGDDLLFKISTSKINEYFKRRAKSVFGTGKSKAGELYSNLTLGDFRHISACYWLPRYKSESALMYRFGWKKSDKIHYYSELLGMKDTITSEDMLIDVTKGDLQREIDKVKQDIEITSSQYKADIDSLKEFIYLSTKQNKTKSEIIRMVELGNKITGEKVEIVDVPKKKRL